MALKSGEIARVNHVFQLTVKYILEKPRTGARETNQGARVVKNLISLWYKSGRNVTMENFFTSFPLAVELPQQSVSLVGTLRSNKADIPPEMKKSPRRAAESPMFGFSEVLTLVSYVPKKNKSVVFPHFIVTSQYLTKII